MSLLSSFDSFVQTVSSTAVTVGNFVNQVSGTVNAIKNVSQFISNPAAFMSSLRLGTFPTGAQYVASNASFATWGGTAQSAGTDWRVRIHIPSDIPSFINSSYLEPLRASDNCMVFPTTPQVMVTHSASYNNLQPIHTNYPFPVYQSSTVEDITITGEFPVENEADGKYWVACVQFLRSVTKMSYGSSPNRGSPPPLVHLSGYGDFIFNKTPIIVKMFTLDLPDSVDYIKVPLSQTVANEIGSGAYTYVPTLCRFSITVQPVYSRDKQRQFNLDTFVQGGYISEEGFI